VESRLHIHPSLQLNLSGKAFRISDGRHVLARVSSIQHLPIEKIEGWYCPEFGLKEKCVVLRTRSETEALPSVGGWQIMVED
jgi:hypothetical protein